MIYLKHAVHGCKVALCEPEAVADEANGWERYAEPIIQAVADVVEVIEKVKSKSKKSTVSESVADVVESITEVSVETEPTSDTPSLGIPDFLVKE